MTKVNQDKAKNIAIVVLGVIVFLFAGYFVSENTGDRSNDKTPVDAASGGTTDETASNPLLESGEVLPEGETREIPSITYSEMKEAMENNEKRIIFLGSATCGWCNYQRPILEYVLYQYPDVNVYYLDVNALTNDEYSDLTSLHESLAGFGTPTFIVFENGEVTSVDQGARGISGLISLLTEYGFISESE